MRAYLLKQAIDGRVIHVELQSVGEMVRLLSNATNNICPRHLLSGFSI
jgi:hypothetical protein